MINNQSDKPEKLTPKDSERKDIQHPENTGETVQKPEDKNYEGDQADFGDVAKTKENSEVTKN